MNQNKTMGAAVTGVCVAMAAGTAAYMMAGHSKKSNTKKLKKTAGKAIRAVGDVVDNFSQYMR